MQRQDELIAAAADLVDEPQRRRFLRRHPEVACRDFVLAVCDRAVELLWIDLEQANRLVDTGAAIAESLGDDHCRGRCRRTSANLFMAQKDFRSAVREYEAALEVFRKLEDRSEAAITQYSALHSLCHLGRFDQAFEWASEAREVFRQTGDRLRLARLESNVGTILSRQDRFPEALARYRSAYREFLDVGSPGDVGVALRNIAVSLQDSNRFAEALEAYREARAFCAGNDLPLLLLETEYNIAYLHFLRGEYARAIRLFELNRKHCRRLGDPHHAALCDLDQSEIYLELNLIAEAAQLARRGRAGFERLGMQYEVAKCSTNLAIARSRQGESEEALELLAEARRIFAGEDNPVWSAMTDFYRARILHGQGRHDDAYRLVAAARRAFETARLPSRAALCEIQEALLDLDTSAPVDARRRASSALEKLSVLGLPALEHRAWMAAARAEEELGNRAAALDTYRRAEATLERLRSHLRSDELKISFFEDKNDVYQSLVSLMLRDGDGGTVDHRAVFETIERAKSRGLADLLAFRAAEMPTKSAVDGGLVRQLRDLRQDLNSLYRKIDLGLAEGGESARRRLDGLRRECRRREQRLLRALRELRSVDAELSSLQAATTLGLEAVRSTLPADSLLVEYYFARETVYACVVGRRELDVVPVSSVAKVRELHRYLKYQLSRLLLGEDYAGRYRETLLRSASSYLRSLYGELVEPLRSRLRGYRHLVVVPHDVLHHVPFHALYDGEEYLIDRFSISYAPSASVFYLCRAKAPAGRRRSLILGVDDERAPRIRKEVESAARILPDAALLLGEEATEESLRSQGADARIVHLATHGFFRRDSPMFSAIQLGKSRLSLFDLYDLELKAELVVLSGCGTGLHEVTAAEELVGLTRGLLHAGARAVLATLWDVDDDTTAALVETFYRRLQTEAGTAAALRGAMREIRARRPHPYYWAPFVLIGEPEGWWPTDLGQGISKPPSGHPTSR